jgi:hypothetical protein
MEQRDLATHHAVLIGINAYPESPMKGCVRDVQEIKKYLEGMPNPVHIQMFTASPTEDSSSSSLAENLELWPTHDNVTSSLKKTTSLAEPGDFVYIHYSGHGTTIKPSRESSNWSTRDLALVLLEVTDRTNMRYLRGLELAYLLRDMVEKRLTVTLVLDCCFSGSVLRKDSLVRYLSYDPKIDAAYPPNPSYEPEASHPAYRNASMRPNWLVNPDGYSILTACGPTEIAKELVLNKNGQRHGALSYFLLRTFAKLGGVGGNQQHIYHHICARFRETRDKRKNEQNPMFYGNKNLCFFGRANLESHPVPIPIIKKPDGSIHLEAGQAHGVCDRDQFAVYPVGSAKIDFVSKPTPVIASVTQVRALTSDMKVLDTKSVNVETGWMATALTYFSLRRFPIQLELPLPCPSEWVTALQERKSLDIHDSDNVKPGYPFSFYVAPDGTDGYEIRDETNRQILNLPTLTQHQEETAYHVLDVVEHLARFKLVKTLTNASLADPAHHFRRSFTIQLFNRAGKVFQPGCLQEGWFHPGCSHPECVVEAEDGEKLELVVKNTGDDALHLHLYSMGHCWEIENILRGNHEVIPQKEFSQSTTGEWRKKIEMTISPEMKEKGQSQLEDIIKVFLTVRPTSFMSLELPELVTPIKGGETAKTRGGDCRHLSEDWAALNFRIRTYV